jgi:hypothetical protein
MALQNLRLMAAAIAQDKEQFIRNFTLMGFCTLEQARQLRAHEFPRLYIAGTQAMAQEEARRIEQIRLLEQAHQEEIDTLMRKLQQHLPSPIQIRQTLSSQPATVVVQISPDNLQLTSYHYRIQGSRDLHLEDFFTHIREALNLQPGDFRWENNILKVTKKLLPKPPQVRASCAIQ